MVIDVNVLTNGWAIAGVIASLTVAFVALGLGLMSIYETRRLYDIKFREEVLEKISDWLRDVTELKNVGSSPTISELYQVFADTQKSKLSLSLEAWNKQLECLKLAMRGTIMVSNFHDTEKPLPKAMNGLMQKLIGLSDLNRQYSGIFANLPSDSKFFDISASLGKYNTDSLKLRKGEQGYMATIMSEVTKLRYKKPFS